MPSLLVSRNLTALLLSPSPEFSTFEELPIPGVVLAQVPNAANGEVAWQPQKVLPWPALKRDHAERSSVSGQPPAAAPSGHCSAAAFRDSPRGHSLPRLFPSSD